MKQTVHMSVRKMLSCIVVLSVIIGMGMLASCSSNDKPGNGGSTFEKADLVVYGKIFTSDDNKVVEAFAVKDGKYVYVGDRTGAEAYVEAGKTEVVDYRGKGLVMPGCGNGHAHYSMAHALKSVGASVGLDDNPSKFLTEIVFMSSRVICLLANSWMPSAVIFLCTSQTMRVTRGWQIPPYWSRLAS